MDPSRLLVKPRLFVIIFLLTLCYSQTVNGYNKYTVHDSGFSFLDPDIVSLEHSRHKRAVPAQGPADPADPAGPVNSTSIADAITVVATAANTNTAEKTSTDATNITVTDDSNKTVNTTTDTNTSTTLVSVTQIPLLGTNGTGILKVTTSSPKVSEPIIPDDNLTDVFRETPETLKAEQNITDLKYDNHSFYNSAFIGNLTYFNEYWANLTTVAADVHPVLSHSHRRATTLTLKFDFPFYGHSIRNITVATGGFIYTGEHVHNWLAATQYIAPLMANFDTTLTNDSYVKMYNEEDRFTAFWENVTVQEDLDKKFTFAVTLYKTGDIDFAYKDIPIPVQNISDSEHPVKVGISDAYLNDKIFFLIRRKTIYEYHRVSFKNYEISNGTILRLTALPTCLQYDTCDSCVNHDTGFDCMWCEAIHKCSSGTDRNKQDWMLRNCEKVGNYVTNESSCPARGGAGAGGGRADTGNTAYVTDVDLATHQRKAVVSIVNESPADSARSAVDAASPEHAHVMDSAPAPHSPLGGVVAALVAITLVCGAAAWALYAFKNPHTRSGQLLIKYRPSQWSWRRGEARYTAATIHM